MALTPVLSTADVDQGVIAVVRVRVRSTVGKRVLRVGIRLSFIIRASLWKLGCVRGRVKEESVISECVHEWNCGISTSAVEHWQCGGGPCLLSMMTIGRYRCLPPMMTMGRDVNAVDFTSESWL